MKMESIREDIYIGAISRLLVFAAGLRHHVQGNQLVVNDEIGKYAVEINNEVIRNINVDLFKNPSTMNILKYETYLSKLLQEFTNEIIVNGEDLEDEIYLLDTYKDLSKDYFSDFNYTLKKQLPKDFQLKYRISEETVFKGAMLPYFIHAFDEDDLGNNYLTTYKRGNYVFLYHLYENNKKRELEIESVFIFKTNYFKSLFENPTRLFLRVLDEYGLDLKVNGVSRRFFKKARVHGEPSEEKSLLVSFSNHNKNTGEKHAVYSTGILSVNKLKRYTDISFIYAVVMSDYLKPE